MSTLTLTDVRHHVADVLGEPADAIGDHEDLLDLGLDSIRLMSLIDRWRSLGHTASIEDLAEIPTVSAWSRLLSES